MSLEAFSTSSTTNDPGIEQLDIPIESLPEPGTEMWEYLYPYLDPATRTMLLDYYGHPN